ncbi:MAG: pyruvate:ferredoxin (flavodoxin) oxidoreductase [Ruminiclostridium sp.]|jgi:pyruvate-ferredoxin/flavodoxin oxidoreductase|nr:pyruvate:ferredoxin (flavodoxin) oxidoreductase [Ruminiclostridium sp.]MCI9466573.1 pyruvate:ferredoxin (flavodoxin) oxidoreductase [Ruminiclostridium sp.]
MARKRKTMDGNTAAAHVAYAFTEVAAIYPITPSSVMAELSDKWAAEGRKNMFGQTVNVSVMQSEGGAAGAVHGSLTAGALTTTFTASQGLLLMIPNMYKIAGSLLPGVTHVSARALATHALSIFGDHSDVMSCRSTGYALLCSNNPQEVMDLGAVAHLAAIGGRVPFLHFFDGFRTSHEIKKVETWDYEELKDMVDMDALNAFRARALNPDHPVLRGSAQNPDIFFQTNETRNQYYDALPAVVEEYMDKVNQRLGTNYQLFNYYGAEDAETVMVAMGSVCDAAEEVVDYMNAKGEKVGLIKVRLYRPFVTDRFVAALPATAKNIVVLDRCKEPSSIGEPLYQDVVTALAGSPFAGAKIVGGRYGLGSKDTTPGGIMAAFRNGQQGEPVRSFTINIVDDVTNRSLPIPEEPDVADEGTIACKFWGLGGDGTVGANKNSIKIIGDNTDMQVQAYFQYDSKKSGGVTVSHLRFGRNEIKASYYVTKADFVACHLASYIEKFDIVQDVKPGGTFLLNCPWNEQELEEHLPAAAKRYLAQNNIRMFTCDATHKAIELGMGNRSNTILQAAFFKLANVIPVEEAVQHMKDAIVKSYGHKGMDIIMMNYNAVDAGIESVREVLIPAGWVDAVDVADEPVIDTDRAELAEYVKDVMIPANAMRGDAIPVSKLMSTADGTLPQGTAAFEKRGIAVAVPSWDQDHCIQCNLCSYICPHSCIRPIVMDANEVVGAPKHTKMHDMRGKGCEIYAFSMTVSVLDCTGCGSCVEACPAKTKALAMKPLDSQMNQQAVFDYGVKTVTKKQIPFAKETVKGSQFEQPLFEFSGACAGCGETPYVKLVTQLFGDRMYIANATGCTSIWGGSAPSTPYTVNREGRGPAWENSLFEDGAEFGYGMNLAVNARQTAAADLAREIAQNEQTPPAVTLSAQKWLNHRKETDGSRTTGDALATALDQAISAGGANVEQLKALYDMRDMFAQKSVWAFGGDGWAYDIGYGGVDHVLASGENVNILVLDTEVYSNTGGQASKATNTGAVAQFAAAGKSVRKKDLAAIAMQYGSVYVAQIAMGADYNQTIRALIEAESYPGTSIVIAYAPCISHGIKMGMKNTMLEMSAAVQAGYWHLFRYDPRRAEAGKNPFQLDSPEPIMDFQEFISGEVRYSSLQLTFPDRARELFARAEQEAKEKYQRLEQLSKNWQPVKE